MNISVGEGGRGVGRGGEDESRDVAQQIRVFVRHVKSENR